MLSIGRRQISVLLIPYSQHVTRVMRQLSRYVVVQSGQFNSAYDNEMIITIWRLIRSHMEYVSSQHQYPIHD